VPERELPCVPGHEIEPDAEDDVDPDGDDDVEEVRVDPVFELRDDKARERGDEEPCLGAEVLHQTFSRSALPRRPVGLKRRMRMSTAKAMASRYIGEI